MIPGLLRYYSIRTDTKKMEIDTVTQISSVFDFNLIVCEDCDSKITLFRVPQLDFLGCLS